MTVPSRRALAILVGANTPFICWLGYAALRPLLPADGLWCPTHALLGWCPACGLTTAFSGLLYHAQAPGLGAAAVLVGFGLVALASLRRAWRGQRQAATAS